MKEQSKKKKKEERERKKQEVDDMEAQGRKGFKKERDGQLYQITDY